MLGVKFSLWAQSHYRGNTPEIHEHVDCTKLYQGRQVLSRFQRVIVTMTTFFVVHVDTTVCRYDNMPPLTTTLASCRTLCFRSHCLSQRQLVSNVKFYLLLRRCRAEVENESWYSMSRPLNYEELIKHYELYRKRLGNAPVRLCNASTTQSDYINIPCNITQYNHSALRIS